MIKKSGKGPWVLKKTLFDSTMILIIFSLLYSFVLALDIYIAYQNGKKGVEETLLVGAEMIPFLLPEDFHDRAVGPDSIGLEEELRTREVFNTFNSLMGYTWMYTLVPWRGDLYFAATTVSEEEALELESWYFYPYEDAPEVFFEALSKEELIFYDYEDQWGHFRSVILPLESPSGNPYLACIDIDISVVKETIIKRIHQVIYLLFTMLIITMPLVIRLLFDRDKIKTINKELDLHRQHLAGLVEEKTKHLKEKTEILIEKEEQLALTLAEGDMEILKISLTDRTVEFHEGNKLLRLFGYSEKGPSNDLDTLINEHLHPEERDGLYVLIDQFLSGALNSFKGDFRIKSGNDWLWVSLLMKVFEKSEQKKRDMVFILVQIVHEQRLRERDLKEKAMRDSLTGLYNREFCFNHWVELQTGVHSDQFPFCFCFIDINWLKEVNDTLGHDQGDNLLIDFSKLVGGSLRNTDYLCRIGGDEFILICSGIPMEKFHILWDRIISSLKNFNTNSGKPYKISCSHGVVAVTGVDELGTFEDFISKADALMYAEKKLVKESGATPF